MNFDLSMLGKITKVVSSVVHAFSDESCASIIVDVDHRTPEIKGPIRTRRPVSRVIKPNDPRAVLVRELDWKTQRICNRSGDSPTCSLCRDCVVRVCACDLDASERCPSQVKHLIVSELDDELRGDDPAQGISVPSKQKEVDGSALKPALNLETGLTVPTPIGSCS